MGVSVLTGAAPASSLRQSGARTVMSSSKCGETSRDLRFDPVEDVFTQQRDRRSSAAQCLVPGDSRRLAAQYSRRSLRNQSVDSSSAASSLSRAPC